MNRRGARLAIALTLLRLALAPMVMALLAIHVPPSAYAVILIIGFLSDVVDGIVARRAGAATPGLRRLDSAVDVVFYLAIAFAAWRLYPTVLQALVVPIGLVLGGEALNYGAALAKYGREPSYHAWSAKAWGLFLFLALICLFALSSGRLLPIALGLGVLAQLEALAMTFVLPTWHHDVPTLAHAWRLRTDAR